MRACLVVVEAQRNGWHMIRVPLHGTMAQILLCASCNSMGCMQIQQHAGLTHMQPYDSSTAMLPGVTCAFRRTMTGWVLLLRNACRLLAYGGAVLPHTPSSG